MSKNKKSIQKNIHVVIDHPAENEMVSGVDYTFRICPSGRVNRVEISIGGGSWQICREALGYWWFDWKGQKAGNHEAVSRVRLADGSMVVSSPRRFTWKPVANTAAV